MKAISKSILPIVLILMLIISTIPILTVDAADTNDNEISIVYLDSNTIKIKDQKETLIVENIGTVTTVKNLTSGEMDYFKLTSDGLYSSITGETLPIEEILEIDANASNPILKAQQSTRTKDITYKKLQIICGVGAGIAAIAAGAYAIIAALFPLMGTKAAIISGISSMLSGLGGIAAAVNSGSSKHGIRLHLKSYQRNVKGDMMTQWKIYKITKY